MNDGKAGWNWLVNSKKWHWFKPDGRSLCGRYMILSGNDDAQTDKDNSPDNCAECRRRRQKELQLMKAIA